MRNYQRIRYTCEKSSYLSERLIDNFLLHLCDSETRLEKQLLGELEKYRHIKEKMPHDWVPSIAAQYIAFQLFRSGGLARNYLDHPVLQRNRKGQDYVKTQIAHPWRFSFCAVIQPLKDSFFEMEDVLTGEEFLLYSPGISAYENEAKMSMYFMLIGFNGECWQSYGPIAYFKGMQPFDVCFYAKQIDPNATEPDEVVQLIQDDPLPFMLLLFGAEFPLTYHKKDMIVLLQSDLDLESFDVERCQAEFTIEEKDSVLKLSLKKWNSFPHFANCFYSKKDRKLLLTSSTDRGYAKLVLTLNRLGYSFPKEPSTRVTPTMLATAKEILGKDLPMNPYEKLFREAVSEEDQASLGNMNRFLQLLVPAINSGGDYDIRKLANEAGIENETAIQIAADVIRMRGKAMLGK